MLPAGSSANRVHASSGGRGVYLQVGPPGAEAACLGVDVEGAVHAVVGSQHLVPLQRLDEAGEQRADGRHLHQRRDGMARRLARHPAPKRRIRTAVLGHIVRRGGGVLQGRKRTGSSGAAVRTPRQGASRGTPPTGEHCNEKKVAKRIPKAADTTKLSGLRPTSVSLSGGSAGPSPSSSTSGVAQSMATLPASPLSTAPLQAGQPEGVHTSTGRSAPSPVSTMSRCFLGGLPSRPGSTYPVVLGTCPPQHAQSAPGRPLTQPTSRQPQPLLTEGKLL
jgi:hypothetical protein